MNNGSSAQPGKIVSWYGELPTQGVQPMARVPGTVSHRDELWERCYTDLMAQIATRLGQEVLRLGGACAHVLDESADSRHDPVSGEAWLHGRITYVLYGLPRKP